jgi:hypothetical protein
MDGTGVRLLHDIETSKQCRFSSAGCAKQNNELPLMRIKARWAQGVHTAECNRYVEQ